MAYMYIHSVLLCLFGLRFISAQANNMITTVQYLRDPEILVSTNVIFKAGFFSPKNSRNRYFGIWYSDGDSDGDLEIVWVANRDNPLKDSTGVLKVSDDGNLEVVNAQNKSFWSSNVQASGKASDSVAQLLDSGNLVLLSNANTTTLWQSFDNPTDTLLPEMTFTIDGTMTKKQVLFRSWKTPSDPSGGNYTVGIKTRTPPQVLIWDGDRPYWRNGPWNGNVFVGVNSVLSIVTDNANIYFGFSLANQSPALLHFVVNNDGNLVERSWDNDTRKWGTVWITPQSKCDSYGKCGPFGSCNATESPICSCLRGFVPKNITEWNRGNWTDGCVRRTPLQCGVVAARADGFSKLEDVKVPDDAVWSPVNSEDECSSQCLDNCSCLGYGYVSSIGCMSWNSSLIDIEELPNNKGIVLSVRLAYSELGISYQQKPGSSVSGRSSRWKVIVIVVVIMGTAVIGVCMCYLRIKWLRRKYGVRRTRKETRQDNSMPKGDRDDAEFGDLPTFEFEKLVAATKNFQESNKLGRGGFGTVYKGELEDGVEVAVKRLSKVSGQGLTEFMTEVLVISKLQHRNLVRLLGCCVRGEEKLLVYEYMPNKSLDALLFESDHVHHEVLGWKTRFNIIQGICRGLLYLHRDSRLRIIHRDLKASNILLDENLNPKISDFGMARIFAGNEDQADTNRVVGTYGYMSPEYAMNGRFSEKSDVFSLGVLLLEIVSGRRNNSFKDEESLSLLGHAWKLWNEDDIVSLIDPLILESSFQDEILRCIQIALLCVQELPEDRPNMSMVISMIVSEDSHLPHPTQLGFTQRRYASRNNAVENEVVYGSVNRLSLSYISGR